MSPTENVVELRQNWHIMKGSTYELLVFEIIDLTICSLEYKFDKKTPCTCTC
jgi:hypothetical protein